MSKAAALYQALAACGAAMVVFIGVCHEVVGHVLFPWGPALLGGAVGWHAAGIFTIGAGLLVLAGTLQLIKFPVIPFALIAVFAGFGLVVVTAIIHREFHMFALAAGIAGAVTAFCHARASALRRGAHADGLSTLASGLAGRRSTLFVVRFADNPERLSVRKEFLPAHLQWLERHSESVLMAGALRPQPDAQPVGAFWVVEADDKDTVQALLATDPFWVQGLRQSFEILHFSKAFPERRVPI
jgi:uncharacterized protein